MKNDQISDVDDGKEVWLKILISSIYSENLKAFSKKFNLWTELSSRDDLTSKIKELKKEIIWKHISIEPDKIRDKFDRSNTGSRRFLQFRSKSTEIHEYCDEIKDPCWDLTGLEENSPGSGGGRRNALMDDETPSISRLASTRSMQDWKRFHCIMLTGFI